MADTRARIKHRDLLPISSCASAAIGSVCAIPGGAIMIRWLLCLTVLGVLMPRLAEAQEVHFLIAPDTVAAKQCETEAGKDAWWNALPEPTRRDAGFQAEGLGIAPEQHRQALIVEHCTLARDGLVDTYSQTQGLAGWGEWWCKASWNDKCLSKEVVTAPEGSQICRVIYSISKDRGDNRFLTEASAYLQDGPGKTRRFRTLTMTLDARGKGSLFNQESAHFRLTNVLVTMVPEYWSDAARRKNGCLIPAAPPVPLPPQPSPGPLPQPIPATFSQSTTDGGHSYRFGFANSGSVPTTMGYEVYMFDASGERLWGTGSVTIAPNTTWASDGFHNWNAVSWRTRFFMITN